jgi:2-polyprenyl-3-methyl-5-hydroxy-6-metoxy-1,4-benzoquinol methylase
MFLSPKPSEDILTSIYANDDYFQDYYATQDGLKDYIEGMRDYDHNDNLILNLISGYKKGGRLLDIGCAAGRFLKNARQAGFDVFGIEPNKRLAAYAKDAFGLEVECATLDNAHLEKESFDVIYAADVIEHLPDLQNSMDLIKALLNKDGILVINQPLSYNRSFFNLLLKLNMLLKTSRCSQNPPTHLWEFTPMTLRRFLKNNGFKVVYFETSESMPKPFRIMNFRDCLRFYIKKISAAISNSRYLERLYLGDRGIVICKK